MIAEFHWTDLVICSHSREGKTLSYSQINEVLRVGFLERGEGVLVRGY